MTGTRWEWRDNASKSGHLQRISAPAEGAPLQAAYRSLLEHGSTCTMCRANQECETGQTLYRAWRTAGGPRGS